MQGDFLCRNYILNGLDDSLYNVYSPIITAKKLWASLDKKYKTEDDGTKKFIVGQFLEYKMVDSMTVISQMQEFQLILHEIEAGCYYRGETPTCVERFQELPEAQAQRAEVRRSHCEASNRGGQPKVREKEQ